MPIGYGLIIFRLVEILIKIILGKQNNLNLLDEAQDAIKSFKFDNNNPK
jgi:TRAP-type C4-dicarboxylate transport system permease small subunit